MTAPHSCFEPTLSQTALWFSEAIYKLGDGAPIADIAEFVANKAYKAGADKELESCCKWLDNSKFTNAIISELMSARRPATLKAQALKALSKIESSQKGIYERKHFSAVRAALDSIPEDS